MTETATFTPVWLCGERSELFKAARHAPRQRWGNCRIREIRGRARGLMNDIPFKELGLLVWPARLRRKKLHELGREMDPKPKMPTAT